MYGKVLIDKFKPFYDVNLKLLNSLNVPYELEFEKIFDTDLSIKLEEAVNSIFERVQTAQIIFSLFDQLEKEF